ncbi:hypothetical protein ACGFW5_30640 [Streptomyces sp. NPDC048416]|uniref:hypothetical protein n=1 Tax=Streptomyces sp. NPDC048416 TaxID=3365546 RepID=UPI00371B23A8
MDSRIDGGPGGQPRAGRAAKEHPQHDATMQLGVFTAQLIKPGATTPGSDKPGAARPGSDKPEASKPELARTGQVNTPEQVDRVATQQIPVFKPLSAIPSQRGHDRPVFVDASGRRGKKLRWLGWIFGLAATGFAVALVGSLLGGSASAPGLTIPDDGTDDAVTAPPQATASQAPEPKASPKKIVLPSHSIPKAPSPKAPKSSKVPHNATPVTGHSPVNTKASPPAGASHKPATGAVSPSGGKTGA